MPDNGEKYLTVQEAADQLRLTKQAIWEAVDQNKLTALQFGERRMRIRQSDLDDWVARSTRAATA